MRVRPYVSHTDAQRGDVAVRGDHEGLAIYSEERWRLTRWRPIEYRSGRRLSGGGRANGHWKVRVHDDDTEEASNETHGSTV